MVMEDRSRDGSALWLADSLLIRDLCGWQLPAIVSQSLYKLHNRSCELGSPESTPASRVLQELSLALWAHSLWLLFRKSEPFRWVFDLPCVAYSLVPSQTLELGGCPRSDLHFAAPFWDNQFATQGLPVPVLPHPRKWYVQRRILLA